MLHDAFFGLFVSHQVIKLRLKSVKFIFIEVLIRLHISGQAMFIVAISNALSNVSDAR